MSLKERILADMKTAMRAKETIRLETIRMLRAAIQRKEVDERKELSEEEVLGVLQKMVKLSIKKVLLVITNFNEQIAAKFCLKSLYFFKYYSLLI